MSLTIQLFAAAAAGYLWWISRDGSSEKHKAVFRDATIAILVFGVGLFAVMAYRSIAQPGSVALF